MTIRLNKKKYNIKTGSELTCKEYIDLWNAIKETDTDFRIVLIYISVLTGVEFGNIADIDIDDKTLRRIGSYIGNVLPLNELPESKEFYFGLTGERFTRTNLKWRTTGVRLLLSERKTTNIIELYVYLLAILITKNYDSDKIEKNYKYLLERNYLDVLSFSAFFFDSLKRGRNSGSKFIRMLKRILNINTAT